MTTKEYVLKYKLNESNKFNHSEFIKDLTNDFLGYLEYNKANDNIKGFENALKCINDKFKAIENKTLGVFPEKLWGYFFATVVVKLREEMCPRDTEKRRKIQEEKQRQYEQRKKQREWENEQLFNSFFDADFLTFLFGKQTKKPIESMTILGLGENATAEDVKTAYRKLCMVHHPDKGGKQEDFLKITEAKNKCLNYLST